MPVSTGDINLIKKELIIYKEKFDSVNKLNIKLEEEMTVLKKKYEENNNEFHNKLSELIISQK
jgi:mevalonate kinase